MAPTYEGLNVLDVSISDLGQMQELAADAGELRISRDERRVLQRAVARATREWSDKHAEIYRAQLAVRDEQHAEIMQAIRGESTIDEDTPGLIDEIENLTARVRRGTLTPAKARAKLRDLNARRRQLVALHEAVERMDESLADFAQVTPAEHQRDFYTQFAEVYTQVGRRDLGWYIREEIAEADRG
ncbi:hypothetical protein Val02_27040 [Virgisporangium aliadipatigenens]|uniref:Uncharacterized protein n=1 Tax=Virgisporangium aliadipatigenens TaxID=741659 RepID=A0A8J3YL70_9ACTN|nr:hypothetical protein [Virgisporangium aliadipatigenens]GIJ45818.1 hypothetical protein Val02_27040 [Virgisporangium aliadipatigenens]